MEKGWTLRVPLRMEPTKEHNTAHAQKNKQLELWSVSQLQLVTSVKKKRERDERCLLLLLFFSRGFICSRPLANDDSYPEGDRRKEREVKS